MPEGVETQVLAASVAVAGVFLLLRWIRQNGTKDDGKRHPPSLPLLPLVGSIIRGGMTVLPEHFMRSAEKLGPVYSFKVGSRMIVVLNSYEAIFNAMVRHSEAFADRGILWIEDKILNHELRGLAFIPYDDRYKKYHKLSLSILKEFGFGVQRVTETRILQEVESMNEEILKQNGRPFDPKWPLSFATSSVVLSILFGKNFLQSSPKDHFTISQSARECLSNFDLILNIAPISRFLPVLQKKIDCMRRSLKNLLKGIDSGIQFNKSNNSEATFVGRFLEIEGANYDHQDLLYVLRDFCFGSSDTVSSTMEWALVEFANHPEVLTRFYSEIEEVVPKDRLPSLDDKPYLPYAEAVILEIWRRHTIVPFLVPHATLKDTKVLEFDVPNGCMVIANAYSAHMDQTFWKDPENFRPERFLDENRNIINSERVITFGLGKRACIAESLGRQETFLFLTSLVQRFDIRPPEGQSGISVTKTSSITTAPSPFEVRLISRMKPSQGLAKQENEP